MADGSFLRWPRCAPVEVPTGAFHMASVEGPAEVVLYSPVVEVSPVAGAMHYALDLVSDTGPAAEPTGVVMLVAFDVPADLTDEVDRWYDEEHINLLMRADGWLRARRFRVPRSEGGPRWTSLAFHELRDISVMASPERAYARSTPWRAELEKGEWFGAAGRGVFQPI